MAEEVGKDVGGGDREGLACGQHLGTTPPEREDFGGWREVAEEVGEREEGSYYLEGN